MKVALIYCLDDLQRVTTPRQAKNQLKKAKRRFWKRVKCTESEHLISPENWRIEEKEVKE